MNYGISVSSSSPSDSYASFLARSQQILDGFGNDSSKITHGSLRRSVFGLNVYYDELNFAKTSEVEKTSVIDLIAAIGGYLGLTIGISFLSFVDMFDFIIKLVHLLIFN